MRVRDYDNQLTDLVGAGVVTHNFCCGVMEVGEFTEGIHAALASEDVEFTSINGADVDEGFVGKDWNEILDDLRGYHGRSLTFTFNNEKHPFLTLIYEQEDHLFIHEWTNPSSGNKIVMVMLTNGSKVTKS